MLYLVPNFLAFYMWYARSIDIISIPHLKGKTVWHKIQHVEPVKITNVTKTILDKYKKVTI